MRKSEKVRILCVVFGVLFLGSVGWAAEKTKETGKMQDKSLMGYWSLDEGSGDAAGCSGINALDGEITNAEWTTEGVSGSALLFSGDSSFVQCGDLAPWEVSDITVEAWMKPNVVPEGDFFGGVIGGTENGGYNNGWRILDCEGKLLVQVNVGDQTPKSLYGKPLEIGKWYHIAFTYDHQYLRLYQNGVQVCKLSEKRDINWPGAGELNIGRAQFCFNGAIDEVKIYNRALTEAEVKTSYESKAKK